MSELAERIATFEEADERAAAIEALRAAARHIARVEIADAVQDALADYSGSLRDLQRSSGLDPATISRLSGGGGVNGATVASLAQIALALDKTLKISIE
jgi:hypothetical protein